MNKPFLTVLVVIAVGASVSAAIAQSVVTAKYADTSVNLIIPKSHCVIPRDDEIGALHYKRQEDANRDSNKVAILFADSRQWAERKANPALLLQNHGNYLFQLIQGQERLVPAGTTRADVVQAYVDYEIKTAGAGGSARRADLTAYLKQKAPSIHSHVNFGLLDRDENGAYIGVGGTFVNDEKPVRFLAVVVGTTTRSVPVTINLYGPAAKGNAFGDLLARQKQMMRQFVAANE